MMSMKRISILVAALPWAFSGGAAQAQTAPAARPTVPQICQTCHKPEAGSLRGVFENVAFKTKSMQVKIDSITEIIAFDDALKVVDVDKSGNAKMLADISKNREILVEFAERDGRKVATAVTFKGPIKIAPEKTLAYDAIEKLVAQGPEKGNFTLIDSRPLPRFQEGYIPGAINLPYPQFDKFLDRLPKEKDRLVVFYCAGVTCMMSPNSLRRVEKMGYTNAKVYREGMPEWSQKNVGVLSAAFLSDAWIGKDIPHVLIDARAPQALAGGFVKGAVSLPPEKVAGALASFPAKKLKAPIMVYDDGDGAQARAVAKAIVAAGYENVNVVEGGFAAWKAAGYALASGAPADRVAYVPRPRPGSIAIAEFSKIAGATPADTLILDVRNRDEANNGMIKGAKLVPDEELLDRIAEVPKDKRIIAHCSTGTRAEMTYHKLKERGYNVAFLKAGIEIDKAGKFTISED